jgi:hypothetical protein
MAVNGSIPLNAPLILIPMVHPAVALIQVINVFAVIIM